VERPRDRLPRTIGRDRVQAAIRLWSDYFRPHARAVFDRGAPTTQAVQSRRVIHWLQARRASEVSREEVRRNALCHAVNAGAAEQVIFCLERAAVLRPLRDEPFSRNGRPARRWQVNPALFLPAEGRKRVRKVRKPPRMPIKPMFRQRRRRHFRTSGKCANPPSTERGPPGPHS
jgi:hypothetical protein